VTELSALKTKSASDCVDLLNAGHTHSGVYDIYLVTARKFVKVYCDMTTDGGGWLMFQRRQDGSVYFNREWNSYKEGFGNVSGEFWLGNDYLHDITSHKHYTIRMDMEDFGGITKYAEYSYFAVADETDKYRLSLGAYSGTTGDSFSFHNGQVFSTKDRDNDAQNGWHCALQNKGGWWYKNCHEVNLNGPYHSSPSYAEGIEWVSWHGYFYSLKKADMKLRPKQ
ncbi:Ryncolin-1, partial [Lamellibrachia satsuma]